MFKKIITASLIAATLAGGSLATTGPAEAHWHGNGGGIAAGIIGGVAAGAILGAAVAPRYDGGCYVRSRRVWDSPNRFHYERVRVCN